MCVVGSLSDVDGLTPEEMGRMRGVKAEEPQTFLQKRNQSKVANVSERWEETEEEALSLNPRDERGRQQPGMLSRTASPDLPSLGGPFLSPPRVSHCQGSATWARCLRKLDMNKASSNLFSYTILPVRATSIISGSQTTNIGVTFVASLVPVVLSSLGSHDFIFSLSVILPPAPSHSFTFPVSLPSACP